jgi:N-ethylmaleimide reductase
MPVPDSFVGYDLTGNRFLLEVMDAVAGAVGRERVGVRISPQNMANDIDDSDPQTLFNHVAESLARKDIAYLHVIEGDTSVNRCPDLITQR